MLNVTVVEDRADYRAFLEKILNTSADFSVHESYSSAGAALLGIPANPPDIVLTDIGMPGMGGIELVSRLKSEHPNLKIVMITIFEDDDNIFNALQAGACGYVLKHVAIKDPEKFKSTLKEAFEGGSAMSPTIAQRVLEFFRQSNPLLLSGKQALSKEALGKQALKEASPDTAASAELSVLTQREHEILSLLAQGYTDKELAEKLFLSVYTVRTHNTNIYAKLQVRTRSEAVVKFFKR